MVVWPFTSRPESLPPSFFNSSMTSRSATPPALVRASIVSNSTHSIGQRLRYVQSTKSGNHASSTSVLCKQNSTHALQILLPSDTVLTLCRDNLSPALIFSCVFQDACFHVLLEAFWSPFLNTTRSGFDQTSLILITLISLYPNAASTSPDRDPTLKRINRYPNAAFAC